MRSACSTGAKSVVSPRPPTVSVGLSWLCSSGYSALERLEPVHEPVVLRVGDDRRVALVVRVARLVDADREALHLVGRVGEADALVDVVVHHIDSLGTTPDAADDVGRADPARSAFGYPSVPTRSTRRW